MKLLNVEVHKYKCIENSQEFDLDDDVTILVGMNESGKTAILESIAKTNYFTDDPDFKFDTTLDYPRREKKQMDKKGTDPVAITCTYSIPITIKSKIESDIGSNVITQESFSISTKYSGGNTWLDVKPNFKKFIQNKTKEYGISSKKLNEKLYEVRDEQDLDKIISEYSDDKILGGLRKLKLYFENSWDWKSKPIGEYIAREYLKPNLPKFLYYDEYYNLPSEISIENLRAEHLDEEALKTSKALFDLADINVEEIIDADSFEDFQAELEATEALISDILFQYWSTNKNLSIEFEIDKKGGVQPNGNVKILEHILYIRVKNMRARVSLPLKNRSRGFNWFFSFLVWFKKIQEDQSSDYILLLDEPGLNLHASAQRDLLEFIDDLSDKYQIVYTTHSPFMIPENGLERVRTVLETKEGTKISDSIQEKDPETLFPLQAALGYDIAQNLFISKKNLLVEGVSDLIYLQTFSQILEESGRTHLDDDITIVPTGGLEKVATFISLMRGSKLDIVCLLDTFKNKKGKAKIDNLIKEKIIRDNKIKFFDEFLDGYTTADIEDVFKKEDYLKVFNESFDQYKDIQISDLNGSIKPIVIQINKYLGIDSYNHYRPANYLTKKGLDASYFSEETLDNFEAIFQEINKLYNN